MYDKYTARIAVFISSNFKITAIICNILIFRQNLKIRVREVHYNFQNLSRKTQSYQTLAVIKHNKTN